MNSHMKNHKENVQNGTTMDHDSDVSMSDIEQGLGQIRVFETDNEIVVTHYVSARERFFSEYSKFAVKTAQSTVEMCRVIYEAKESLEKSEYASFLKDIGRKSEDSTIRKYLKIGERYDDLIAATNLLPACWTSIHKIAQIPPVTFNALTATDYDMSNMSGKQIQSLIQLSKPKSSTDSACVAPTNSVATTQTVPTSSVQSSSDDDKRDESLTPSVVGQREIELLNMSNKEINVVSTGDTYEVLVRFNAKPSDDSWWDLTEAIENVVDDRALNVEIICTRPLFELVS
jgi:hypothetical protein